LTIYLDAPDWENQPTAAIGNFSCKNSKSGAHILRKSVDEIRKIGMARIIGPMDGDTWHSYRLITETDGSLPFLMEPDSKPHEAHAFRKAGFREISGYFSARVPLANTAQNTPPISNNLTIETWDGENPEALFGQVYDLSTKAFSGNAFYKPIDLDTFLAMYMPIVPMLKKELIFFARRPDRSLAGFLFGIPNYAEGPAPCSAILKTYASLAKGAGRQLAHAFHCSARQLGYETAIHALIHNDNLSALRSAAEGAEIFRRYSLMGLVSDG